jgi:hypothetical protein
MLLMPLLNFSPKSIEIKTVHLKTPELAPTMLSMAMMGYHSKKKHAEACFKSNVF